MTFLDYIRPPLPKTAVVKTYPVPVGLIRFARLTGSCSCGRPDERRMARRTPTGASSRTSASQGGRVVQRHVLYLGEISPSQAAAWRKSIEVFDEDAGHPRTLALFPEDRCAAVTPDASIVQLRLSEMRLCRPRQWGACWLAGQLWRELQLDRFWSERLPANRKGTRWDQVLQVLVSYRLIAPGSEWKLHREWFGRSAMADLLGADFRLAEPHKLYACHDFLLAHKADLFATWRRAGAICSTPNSMCCSTI